MSRGPDGHTVGNEGGRPGPQAQHAHGDLLARDSLHKLFTQVLQDHAWPLTGWKCPCGAPFRTHADFQTHVADVLVESLGAEKVEPAIGETRMVAATRDHPVYFLHGVEVT